MTNIKEKIGAEQIILLVIPSNKYAETLLDVTKYIEHTYHTVCYVSLNKSCDAMVKSLKKRNIADDGFLFIDATNKSATPSAEKDDKYVHAESAANLTGLSVCIEQSLSKDGFKSIMFDSLNTLLIYNKAVFVLRFVHNLINSIRKTKCVMVLAMLEEDSKEAELIKNLAMFVDKTVEVGGEEWRKQQKAPSQKHKKR